MKKMVLVFSLICLMAVSALAQVTSIHDIQYTEDASGDSPLKDQVVTIEGVISAESWAFGSVYYVQDAPGAWNGVMVYDPDHPNAYGDSVRLTATVTEYYGMTELKTVTEYVKLDSGKTVEPALVTSGEIATGGSMAEAYEGVLVKVVNAAITNPDLGHGEWEIDDGSGPCRVDDAADYYFNPANSDSVKMVVGALNWAYGDTKIEPRLAMDVVQGGGLTRIQRIQQVRQSDLIKALKDQISDVSYMTNQANQSMAGDTVKVRGIVTMPTGLSYAGAGIKFILSEPEGGPWSAILSYNADSTAYPTLFEGDIVEMTGYIGEYSTGPSNMTEFWITSPIEIVDFGQPVPAPDLVNTGDLRVPETAEQWGNVMVYVKDAAAVYVTPQYELFAVDDGTGSVLVDDDSDSLSGFPDPPLGTVADSIRGWVYHHYGLVTDSTMYKLEPLYASDVVWGAGPPAISEVARDVDIPTATDAVTITADVVTNLTIAEAAVYYQVIADGAVSDYMKVVMANTEGTTYSGQIPAQAEGSFVNYYVMATDDQAQSTTAPAVIKTQNYCYPVTDGTLSIEDVQYNPWGIADTPFEGLKVEVTGIVTVDTAANNKYEAYAIQDAAGSWSGLFAFGIAANLSRGDEITVYGTATDYNPDWGFKWDNNTVILADSFKVLSSGNSMDASGVSTGQLTGDAAEAWEGVAVEIRNATLTSVNSYDVTFDDGSGECLVDGDFMLAADQDANTTFYINDDDGYLVAFGDTIQIGETVDVIRGIFTFSFGTFKIEVRDANDFGTVTGVNENFTAIPLSYRLEQNFPNPFNPETRIYFELPETQNVKIVIYNMLGQKVRTLISEGFNAGRHIVNWDGQDDLGNVVPTGVYFYRMRAGEFMAVNKMMMMK